MAQELDRDIFLILIVVANGAIHLAHAAAFDLTDDAIRSEASADPVDRRRSKPRPLGRGPLDETVGTLVRLQQRFYVATKALVFVARATNEQLALRSGKFHRRS